MVACGVWVVEPFDKAIRHLKRRDGCANKAVELDFKQTTKHLLLDYTLSQIFLLFRNNLIVHVFFSGSANLTPLLET